MQGRESEKTLSVRRPQPHTTNPLKEEKYKIVGDRKEREDHANRKALALLLKPVCPTPSNTGPLRSLHCTSDALRCAGDANIADPGTEHHWSSTLQFIGVSVI